MFEQIITSNYFLCSILSAPVTGDYFRIIGVLLRLNKEIHATILARIPGSFQELLKIMRDAVIIRPRHANLNPKYKNARILASKAYRVGVIGDYIKYTGSNTKYLQDLQYISVECSRDWSQCWARIQDLRKIGLHTEIDSNAANRIKPQNYPVRPPIFIRNPGPFMLANQLCDFQAQVKNDISCWVKISYSEISCIIQIGADQSHIMGIHPGPVSSNMIINYILTGHNTQYYLPVILPVRGKNLYSYAPVIWFNRSPEFVGRFYKAFKAVTPETGAWDLLLFCALFDLDLATMAILKSASPIIPRSESASPKFV